MKYPVIIIITMLFNSILVQHAPAAEEPRFFKLTSFSGALSLRLQVTDERESTLDNLLRDINRRFIEGGLQLNTEGSIYHPNLLTFRLNLNLVGYSSRNTLFSDATINNSLNNTYNIRLAILKKKKINAEFYARRNYHSADRAFLERYFTTFNSLGFKLRSQLKILPFELDVYDNHIKSESLTVSERDEKTGNIELRLSLFTGPRTNSFIHARYKDYSESVYDIHYKALEVLGNSMHRYGIKDRSTVTAMFSYHRMSGDYDLEVFSGRVSDQHYLRPHLYIDAVYTLNVDNSFSRSFKKHMVMGRLNHRLFQSLLSSLEIGGRFESSNYQQMDAFRYGGRFQYRKKIPSGLVQASYDIRLENGAYTSRQDVTQTAMEYDFSLTGTIILSQPGINAGSIRVTSPDLSYLYVEGVDYMVGILDDAVTITRLPGGAIPGDGRVRVYYEYLSYPDFNLKTRFSQLNLRITFLKYFHLFYNRLLNRQDITSDFLVPPFEDYDRQVAGAQLISRLLNAEYTYETYDSSLSDYTSRSLRVSGRLPLFKWLRLSANVNINRLRYDPEPLFNDFDAYSAECTINPRVNITANAVYRNIKYNSSNYFRDRESILVKFQWIFRNITLNVFYERILTGTDLTERGHDFFSVMLRRTF